MAIEAVSRSHHAMHAMLSSLRTLHGKSVLFSSKFFSWNFRQKARVPSHLRPIFSFAENCMVLKSFGRGRGLPYSYFWVIRRAGHLDPLYFATQSAEKWAVFKLRSKDRLFFLKALNMKSFSCKGEIFVEAINLN